MSSSRLNLNRSWLSVFSWEHVAFLNEQFCGKGGFQFGKTSDGYEKTKTLWESGRKKVTPLAEAIELCRQAHRAAPFLNFNGNTFSAIAQRMSQDLVQSLPRPKVKTFLSGVGHYVAGTISKTELDKILAETIAHLQEMPPAGR